MPHERESENLLGRRLRDSYRHAGLASNGAMYGATNVGPIEDPAVAILMSEGEGSGCEH